MPAMLQLLKASSHHRGAGRESWQAPRAGVRTGYAALLQGRHSSAFTRPSLLGSWPASLCPAARPARRLTSYSWENFSPSLALSRSMLSERSVRGMGGWSRMPADETRREEGEESGYGSAWPRKAQQEHVHSKPRRWAQGGHV